MAGSTEDSRRSVKGNSPSDKQLASDGDTSGGGLDDVRTFVAALTEEERMLIILRRELYEAVGGGTDADTSNPAQRRQAGWQAMLTDLQNRLEGRPYVLKLAHRIRDDIARIEKLQAFEEAHGTDLADFVPSPDKHRA
ncbi:MAG: hypothetical protein JW709_05475 [Sedimentisphaerales bacterium]|nr:hypothetical protein [Sedimentisphaerales bacterium]